MITNVAYPHIESRPGEPARLQRLPRVRVAQMVMEHIAHGWSVEEMCRQHPYLTPAEAHSAMAYYFDHREQIEAEIRQEWGEASQPEQPGQRSPFYLRMRQQGLI